MNTITQRVLQFVGLRSATDASLNGVERRSDAAIANQNALALALQKVMGVRKGNVTVSNTTVMGIVAFFACVRRISQDMATLPINVVENRDNKVRYRTDHVSHVLLNRIPNENESAVTMWETTFAYALLFGAGYIHIERDQFFQPKALRYYRRMDVSRFQDTYGRDLYYTINGLNGRVYPEDMIVVRNFLDNNPVQTFNNLFGLTLSADQYAQLYFANGGALEGYLSTPNGLQDPQVENLRKNFKEKRQAGETPILEYGIEYKTVSGRPVDSELNSTRDRNAKEVCQIFGVHPQLIGMDSTSKYESVEQLGIHYRTSVLRPWAVKVAQELDRKMIRISERPYLHFEYDLEAIAMSDVNTRMSRFEKGLKLGIYTINEVRREEGLNPIANGDTALVQVNQIMLDRMDEYTDKLVQQGPQDGAAANNQNK